MSRRLTEIIKFVFTGGVCFLIEYAALIVLKEWLRLPVVAATPIAFLVSVVFNYLLCVKWVFTGAQDGGSGFPGRCGGMGFRGGMRIGESDAEFGKPSGRPAGSLGLRLVPGLEEKSAGDECRGKQQRGKKIQKEQKSLQGSNIA